MSTSRSKPAAEHPTPFDLDDPAAYGVDPSLDPDGGYEDGNALAGPLAELFRVDVTAAAGCCAGCGRAGPVAELRVYRSGPGLVARCPGCGGAVLKLVRGPADAWLDLRGTISLRIALDQV